MKVFLNTTVNIDFNNVKEGDLLITSTGFLFLVVMDYNSEFRVVELINSVVKPDSYEHAIHLCEAIQTWSNCEITRHIPGNELTLGRSKI